ncbi:4Fe-4S binding protein [uncultured Muribaculum sp.]|uniref:4Fe-4S binding protein n=1 Tax=uncultured Muribaculum sp. TaxID=1918613 RepID=UPI0025DB120B|nr:4Fe-4S binding protein [uncultured Muribaculum sp.]
MANYIKIIRVILALVVFSAITLLFLDVTGTAAASWGFLARWQLIPAILSLNVAVLAGLLLLTLIFGRVYCSVLCPLGIMQDIVARIRHTVMPRKRYSYSRAMTWLRIAMLALFVILIILGMTSIAGLIEPYSEFGRIVTALFKPLYVDANNLMAAHEAADSYRFTHVDYAVPAFMIVIVAMTLAVVAVMAWTGGRTYCNTVCPAGTILGYLSQFSWLRPVIDHSKCVSCGACARKCKASCIDSKKGEIDYTRCVACMDCLDSCSKKAISYSPRTRGITKKRSNEPDGARRDFLTAGLLLAGTMALKAQEKSVDGGLAPIADKLKPQRRVRITPPGSISHRNLASRCTACQLCITNCPNGVLRPSSDLTTFMQPEVSYEKGYCRPECTTCSDVCPAGAILPLRKEERTATQVGHAVWDSTLCIASTEGVHCGNCARHCPAGAITMVAADASDPDGVKIPAVDTERCIGCGACENLCPVRPFSAIHVEGHEVHRKV